MTELNQLPTDIRDGSGISRIGTVDVLRSDEDDVGGAAGVGLLLVFGAVVLLSHLFLDGYYLFFTVLTRQHDVHI